MALPESMCKRGYTFRQHLEEAGWGERKLTVVDLSDEQRAALERDGVRGLQAVMQRLNAWTFPALDIATPLPRQPELVLAREGRPETSVIAPADDGPLRQLAEQLIAVIKQRHGVALPLLSDDRAEPDLLAEGHLIVIGGSHQNALAMKLALRHQTFFIDASVPGDDGWAVATQAGLHPSGHNVVQLTASPVHQPTAMAYLLDAVTRQAEPLLLRRVHRIQPGAAMAEHFPSWPQFVAELPKRITRVEVQDVPAPHDPAALADLLAAGLDSGGPEMNLYNVAPIDIAIISARYYQLSGEQRALQLFHELLIRLADYYLQTPGGASYPADLDFRLGYLIQYYARLEHEPIFNDDDRLILVNLLLACTRSVHEYAQRFWPVTPGGATRHNHETFPAVSLIHAADYFSRFGLPDVEAWRDYARAVFDSGLWRRGKQTENANLYESFVPEHAAMYSCFLDDGLNRFADGALEQIVHRQIMTTDNFFRGVDYGDSAISMRPSHSVLARLLATRENGLVRWYAAEGFARQPEFLANRITDLPGIRREATSPPHASGEWEHISLDPTFLEEHHPGYPAALAFDKLAFRTGWGEADQYLLLEGVGGEVSHAHRETNGIVRLNHLGRHWIVSNGYGKRIGVTNVSQAFRTRVLGPEDHNVLVLESGGGIVQTMPSAAMLQRGREGKLLYATSALPAYGGENWFRTLIVLAEGYVLVIDRIEVLEPGLKKAHVEWNALGNVHAQPNGFRLEQQGVFLDVTSASGWRPEQAVADRSTCWQKALRSGEYPYASFPLAKLVYHMPTAAAGQTHCLATLLTATVGEAAYRVRQPAPGRIVIEGCHAACKDLHIEDQDLAIHADVAQCEVHFAATPELPDALQAWATSRPKTPEYN